MPGALFVGLMSGTSLDGIDAVLVDLNSAQPNILKATTLPWSPTLLERLRAAAQGTFLTAEQFAQLHAETGQALAEAALSVIDPASSRDIQAIGSHGQTLAHQPNTTPGFTLQIGDASRISEATGITTVADFRARDIAAGGQGAPLVPAYHRAVFGSPRENRVVLNIGGIANISILPADGAPLSGFDTGPGNCLMDAWARQHTGQAFDRDGAMAAAGSVDQALLQKLLADAYFQAPAPKSTGTDYFSPRWLQGQLTGHSLSAQDVQATLLALSAHSIAEAIRQAAPTCERVLVCGGGAHNPTLMAALAGQLDCPLESTAAYGIAPDWVEAVAFAWLAQQALAGQPGNAPKVTGAAGPRVLGAIYPA